MAEITRSDENIDHLGLWGFVVTTPKDAPNWFLSVAAENVQMAVAMVITTASMHGIGLRRSQLRAGHYFGRCELDRTLDRNHLWQQRQLRSGAVELVPVNNSAAGPKP